MKQIQTYEDVLAKKSIINKDRAWDIPGGVSIKPDNLIKGRFLPEGTPISPPNASGYRRVCKQALVLDGSSGKRLIVDANFNHFRVGEAVMVKGGVTGIAASIASVVKSTNNKEILSLGSTIATVSSATKPFLICEATAKGVGSASAASVVELKRTPDSITKFGIGVPNADMVLMPIGVYTRADVLVNTIADAYLEHLKHINVIKY